MPGQYVCGYSYPLESRDLGLLGALVACLVRPWEAHCYRHDNIERIARALSKHAQAQGVASQRVLDFSSVYVCSAYYWLAAMLVRCTPYPVSLTRHYVSGRAKARIGSSWPCSSQPSRRVLTPIR